MSFAQGMIAAVRALLDFPAEAFAAERCEPERAARRHCFRGIGLKWRAGEDKTGNFYLIAAAIDF